MTSDSLELAAVRKRFAESADLLDQLRERIRSLALAEETVNDASTSIDEAAAVLKALTAGLSEISDALRDAVAKTEHAMGAAGDFLAGTDLGQLQATLADIAAKADLRGTTTVEQLQRIATGQEALEAKLQTVWSDLAERLRQLGERAAAVDAAEERARAAETRWGEAEARAAAAEAALHTLKAALPERTAKKLGLA